VATNQDIKSWISLFHFLSSKFQALFLSLPMCVCVCVCMCVLSLSLSSLSRLWIDIFVCVFVGGFFFGRCFASTVVVRHSCVCGWGDVRVFSHICFCMCVCLYLCVSFLSWIAMEMCEVGLKFFLRKLCPFFFLLLLLLCMFCVFFWVWRLKTSPTSSIDAKFAAETES